MKKFFEILILFLATAVFAQESQGIKADVELRSGTKQRAQFLGIQNDTVQLGGYIKNQFTIVRIVKSQFKSIVDEQGNDLLNPPKKIEVANQDTAISVNDSIHTEQTSSSEQVQDSSLTAVPQDSVAAQDSIQKQASSTMSLPAKPLEISSTAVMVTLDKYPADSTLSLQIDALVVRLLQEKSTPVQLVNRSEIQDCDDDICIQNKLSSLGVKKIYFGKIHSGATPDSLNLELSQAFYEEELPTIYKASVTLSAKSAISDLLQENKLQNLLIAANGDTIPEKKDSRSYIYVETNPEGATLSRPEENAICVTPCAFTVMDTGKVVLNAYWNVGEHLWGAQTTVHPFPGDTAKISLKLKPVHPEIQIITIPAGAEIFKGDEEITKTSKSLGKTPNKFLTNEPGMASLQLRQIGYKDTTIQFYVAPISETKLNIQMEPITDPNELTLQQEWKKQRDMRNLGQILMSCAAAPIIAGAIFAYLGNKDYEEANDIKDELQIPGSVNGDKYQKMVKENKKMVKDGDKKMIIGASLVGTGAVIFGLGLFFAF